MRGGNIPLFNFINGNKFEMFKFVLIVTYLFLKPIITVENEITFGEGLIFKYGTLQHLEDTLIHNRLGFSKAGRLNDPFEIAHRLMNSVSEETHKRKREFLNNTEISCFSKTPNEPLMWSHYSDKHHGVCYVFDEYEVILYGLTANFGDITYSNHIPTIYYDEYQGTDTNLKRELNRVLFTKSLNWAYEQEYRITLNQGVEKIFRRKSLKGVILGFRASIEYEKRILDIVEKANKDQDEKIKVYYANLSTEKYTITITEKPTRIVSENIRLINPFSPR